MNNSAFVRLWLDGIQLAFNLCLTLNLVFIVVQCDRNDTIWMCTCPVDESLYNLALTLLLLMNESVFKWLTMTIYLLIHKGNCCHL